MILSVFAVIYNRFIIPYHGSGIGTLANISYLPVILGAYIVCSLAGGALFKGKIYVWVWTAAAMIFSVVGSLNVNSGIGDIPRFKAGRKQLIPGGFHDRKANDHRNSEAAA